MKYIGAFRCLLLVETITKKESECRRYGMWDGMAAHHCLYQDFQDDGIKG
jgi:hypothetical protein